MEKEPQVGNVFRRSGTTSIIMELCKQDGKKSVRPGTTSTPAVKWRKVGYNKALLGTI